MNPPVIFAGPSLTAQDRAAATGVQFRPPAAQGDLLRALADRPAAIGLIDGYFGDRLAVHQKEILEVIAAGVPVAGAASMGALRAAELYPWGMVGSGRIFADYVAGRLTSDADVAVAHGPEHVGFAPVSIAMVDVRATVEALARRDRYPQALLDAVLAAAEGLHFTERSWHMIAVTARASGAPDTDIETEFWRAQVQQKRADAIGLVRLIAAGALSAPPQTGPLRSAAPPRTMAYRAIRARALGTIFPDNHAD